MALPAPSKCVWMILTSPVFLVFSFVAACFSMYDHRDVFSCAHEWTHGIFFGHSWGPYYDGRNPNDPEWEICGFCGKIRS